MVWGARGMVSGMADAVGKSYRYTQTWSPNNVRQSRYGIYCLTLLGDQHGLMIMKVDGLFLGGGRAGARRVVKRIDTW